MLITRDLFTTEIEFMLQVQFEKVFENIDPRHYMQMNVICRILHPGLQYSVYPITQDPADPEYLWCIVKGADVVEIGEIPKSGLELIPGFVRDTEFKPQKAEVLFHLLQHSNKI